MLLVIAIALLVILLITTAMSSVAEWKRREATPEHTMAQKALKKMANGETLIAAVKLFNPAPLHADRYVFRDGSVLFRDKRHWFADRCSNAEQCVALLWVLDLHRSDSDEVADVVMELFPDAQSGVNPATDCWYWFADNSELRFNSKGWWTAS